MRRTTTTVVLLAASVALAGCGGGSDKADSKPGPSKTVDSDAAYLGDAHTITFNGTPSDAELLVYPTSWCSSLDEGHSVEWLLGEGDLYPIGDDWGTAKENAYALVVAGVKAYCPRNLPAVKAELRANGNY